MILRSYQIHPGDYDSIVEEMRENRSHLPGKAAEYYAETPLKKLRSRIRDQIFLLMSKKKTITDSEIR